jgi:galactonate dehydratase
MKHSKPVDPVSRRSAIQSAFATLGMGAFAAADAAAQQKVAKDAPIARKDPLKITKLETLLVKPRWLFLKIHTNAGIVGLGEPILEGRALTCKTAVEEVAPYLVGKDPRQVAHHWQAIYRHAFYRGGPILTSVLSGIDQALWDIKGKALGIPVYELLGGPTRNRVRVYAHARDTASIKAALDRGFTAFKTGPAKKRPARYVETPAAVRYSIEQFAELRKTVGDECDIGIDFHGAISPATAKLLIKGLEPYQPMFVEEPCQAQNHDIMAEIARGTHLPIATGERVFTKWGFREVLEKKAATILQPDLCHAGGITEVRLIAGMAEAYYASIAPHNPLGPISLAAGVQIAASIPNFLCQEQVSLGEGYITKPFTVREGYLDLPAGPGLGIELDENALADKINHDWTNQESYDADDGSVVDW